MYDGLMSSSFDSLSDENSQVVAEQPARDQRAHLRFDKMFTIP